MKSKRLYELDGLRGIAALWVGLHHFWGAIQQREVGWVPEWVGNFFDAGFLGVDIFFVLSGFVIMHSVSSAKVDSGFVPRFILRRSVRIDPPYWCAITIAIILMFLKNEFFPAEKVEIPSASAVIAHIFYLQDLLEIPAISTVFWTLCLEFQFYLIFSVFYYIYVRMSRSKQQHTTTYLLIFAIFTCVVSPTFRFSSTDFVVPGTILPYAYEFALGVLCYFWAQGNIGHRVIVLAVSCAAVTTAFYRPVYYIFVPLAVLIILYLSKKTSSISWLKARVMLFLGKISYSFYLTHASVGWVSLSFMMYIASNQKSDALTFLILVAGIAISVIFSAIFYSIIEEPSIKLSRRFRVPGSKEGKKCEVS
mgnify:CR=1 FL=1